MAWLKENIQQARPGLEKDAKRMDLDTFSDIMTGFVKKSRVGLMVLKEEGSEVWEVTGAGCGAVMDFYIWLNALETLYLQIIREMGGLDKVDSEKLAGALCREIKKSMLKAVEAEREGNG